MRADGKNKAMWQAALFAGVVLGGGCATQDSSDEELREGTYNVSSVDIGSCASDSWLKSQVTSSSLLVEASSEGYAIKTCGDAGCSPMAPSSFAWSVDQWRGVDGGAYLVETGCLLVAVDATARLVDNELVIETTRWSSQLTSGSCTYDEVLAMREEACDSRSRLTATIE